MGFMKKVLVIMKNEGLHEGTFLFLRRKVLRQETKDMGDGKTVRSPFAQARRSKTKIMGEMKKVVGSKKTALVQEGTVVGEKKSILGELKTKRSL